MSTVTVEVGDDVERLLSELGFRLTRRRVGRSEMLPTLSSSVEYEASTMGSRALETRTEGTKRDRLGRSLVDVLAGFIILLSWELILFFSRCLERLELESPLKVELLSDECPVELVDLLEVHDESGCAMI